MRLNLIQRFAFTAAVGLLALAAIANILDPYVGLFLTA